jgi:hypothetical protein
MAQLYTDSVALHRVTRETGSNGRLRVHIALPDQDDDCITAGTTNSNIDSEPIHGIAVFAKTPGALRDIALALLDGYIQARKQGL